MNMATTCQICSAEQSKYRCPACGAQSCSLACSQTHKSSCVPQPSEPGVDQPATSSNINETSAKSTSADTLNNHTTSLPHTSEATTNGLDLSTLASSNELQDLLTRYPGLRSQLQDIYKSTLEEEWSDSGSPTYGRRRGRGRGRGRGGHAGGRGHGPGPWTSEKGFNRGLRMVRKLRGSCDEGSGTDAEGFRKFVDLVTAERHSQEPSLAAET